MRYRELGKTGLSVSEIGLGGEWLERHDTKEVKAVIDRCEELGINIKTLNRTVKKLKDTGMIGITKGKLTFDKEQYNKAVAELAVLRKGANHW